MTGVPSVSQSVAVLEFAFLQREKRESHRGESMTGVPSVSQSVAVLRSAFFRGENVELKQSPLGRPHHSFDAIVGI